MTKSELAKAVRAHAIANYENGWDVIVECYNEASIIEAMGEARTVKAAIKAVGQRVTVWNEFAAEIQAEEF